MMRYESIGLILKRSSKAHSGFHREGAEFLPGTGSTVGPSELSFNPGSPAGLLCNCSEACASVSLVGELQYIPSSPTAHVGFYQLVPIRHLVILQGIAEGSNTIF